MKRSNFSLKQLLVAGGALFVSIAAPIEASRLMGYDTSVISAAVAEESHAGKATTKGTKGGAGSQSGGKADQASGGNQGASGQGSKSTEALLKGDGGSATGGKGGSSSAKGGPTADSDAPAWAGVKGGKSGGGGKPTGAGSKKGDLFGDMVVLLRDPVTGAALTEVINGVTYPLVQAYILLPDGTLQIQPGEYIPRDPTTGDLILTTYTTKEVELGRLSVGRSPTKVLDKSLTAALAKLVAADASTTDNVSIVLDAAGRLAIATTVDGVTTVKAIDSPLENLALYKAIANLPAGITTITVGSLTWTIPTFVDINLLKASLLAAAMDKTGTATLDTVMYIDSIISVKDVVPDLFTYDRYTTYKDLKVTVLLPDPNNSLLYIVTEEFIYDVVFKSTNDLTTTTGESDFAQAVDDALQVLEYIHDNAL